MNAGESDGVVRPLRADAPVGLPSATPAITAGRLVELGVTVVREWPGRTVLLLGDVGAQVQATLRRLGLTTQAVEPAASEVQVNGPFVLLVVGAELFADDGWIERVAMIRGLCPTARMLLDCGAGRSVDRAVLIRAVRAGVDDVLDRDDMASVEQIVGSALRAAGRHRERVLAIGAHPDDVEIGCGGTLLDHRMRDDLVSVLTLSRGAVGGDRQRRLAEAAAAAEMLGARLFVGDLPDTAIDSGIETIRLIEEVVATINPTVVYVHSIHDNHQDHRAAHTATTSATRGVRRVFAYQSPSATNAFHPTSFVPIDQVLHRKVELLLKFDSQSGRTYLEPELVTAGSRYWARHLGASARYAEPFEVVRSVGDLRQAETTPALFAGFTPPTLSLVGSAVRA